jgi:uncharacterized SAM-binding protein YcdF (DUF218 family)
MSLAWLLTNGFAALLLPPFNGLLLIGAGWGFRRSRPRIARGLIGSGACLLFVLSLPLVGESLLRSLEPEPLDLHRAREAQAIVLLGGGRYLDAPEYGGDTVGRYTLVRLRYAARLQRETGLPLLVSGGRPGAPGLSEGETMRRVLEQELNARVRWVEGESTTTRENAIFSASILRAAGVQRVLLVSHAWHMPRAVESFRRVGLEAIPAPTAFTRTRLTPLAFLPNAAAMENSSNALHEWIGRFWYWLKG